MKKLFFICAATLLMTSCATISSPVGSAFLYTQVKTGEGVTSNQIGTKVGTAKASNVLGIVASGDASIQTAANSAGIKKISHVDSEKFNILGLFSTYQIFVYGE
jgi:hypothetical protein